MQLKKLSLIVALISSITLSASHIMGGIIQVAQTSPDSTSIGLYLISDQFPTTPQNVSIERWEMDNQ